MADDCVFCDGRRLPADMERFAVEGVGYLVFEPLNPVVEGHRLVVPMPHAADATENPKISAGAMHVAARVARRYPSANIITSVGTPATQSVLHLHLHVVPRADGDGLPLPWTPRQQAARLTDVLAEHRPHPVFGCECQTADDLVDHDGTRYGGFPGASPVLEESWEQHVAALVLPTSG